MCDKVSLPRYITKPALNIARNFIPKFIFICENLNIRVKIGLKHVKLVYEQQLLI
jgi:hypothetical protein